MGKFKIDPLTFYNDAKKHLKDGEPDKFFVNNPASSGIFMKKTHFYGFKDILIEVIPETDQIASICLFRDK